MKLTILAATFLALAAAGPASAVVPPLISYQGVLTDNSGILVPDGPYDFTFTIWDAETAGNLLYCETQTGVPVVRGGFSVRVGEGTLCPPGVALQILPFDGQYWFQVAVGGGPALGPRIKLTAAPYTLMAKTVLPDAITGANVLDGSLTGADIADNSLLAIDIAPNIVSSINGVSNDGGNVSLVAGPGLSLLPDDIANTITVNRQPPSYFVSGDLATAPITANTTFAKIADFLTFTKGSASSVLEVTLNSRAAGGTFAGGAIGTLFAIRLDDNPSPIPNVGAITTNNSVDFISMHVVFTGYAAGSHTVSVWARTSIGTSTGVMMDPGNWGGRILVKETL